MTAHDCDRVREALWPMDRLRPVEPGEEDARAHLEACPACRAWFERDAALGRLLSERGIEHPAPPELRERLMDALARERTLTPATAADEPGSGRGRRWAWTSLAAAAAAILVLATIRGVRPPDAFALDFRSHAADPVTLVSREPDQVREFFEREMGVAIAPASPAGATLRRVMVCLIDGRRAAMVEYEMGGHRVAHYRVPVEGGAGPASAPEEDGDGELGIVRWRDGGFEHTLVGPLPAGALARIARTDFGATGA